jgi:ferredoxin-type protein NapH
MKKIRFLRMTIQLAYLALILAGLFTTLRPLALILLIASLVFGNFFCGWICVFGTMQNFVSRISSIFIKKKLKIPYRIQKYLQLIRYMLAAIFALALGREAGALPFNSYRFSLGILNGHEVEILAAGFIILFLVISIFFERPFCNYVCSEGVRYGIASFTRLFSIKREKKKCIQCKKCDSACPMNIHVSAVNHVRNAQCINCFSCISSCPVKSTLHYGFVNVFKIIKEKLAKKFSRKSTDKKVFPKKTISW